MKYIPIHTMSVSYEIMSALVHKYFIIEEVNEKRRLENMIDRATKRPWEFHEKPLCSAQLGNYFIFPIKVWEKLLTPVNYVLGEMFCLEFTCSSPDVTGTFKFLPRVADPVALDNPGDDKEGFNTHLFCSFDDLHLLSSHYVIEEERKITLYD